MSGPNFQQGVTVVGTDWARVVTSVVYDVLGAAGTAAEARTALGLKSMAVQDASAVNIVGGSVDNTVIGAVSPAEATFLTVRLTGDPSTPDSAASVQKAGAIADTRFSALLTSLLPVKGDLPVRAGASVTKLPVGENSSTLLANTAASAGMSWGTFTMLVERNPLDDPGSRGAAGDIQVRTATEYARLPLGASGQVLTVDRTRPQGVRWATLAGSGGPATGAPELPLTALGDLLSYTGSVYQRVPLGSAGQVLTAVPGVGVRWQTPVAGGPALQFQNNGVNLGAADATVLNIVNATVVRAGSTVTMTVPSGGSGTGGSALWKTVAPVNNGNGLDYRLVPDVPAPPAPALNQTAVPVVYVDTHVIEANSMPNVYDAVAPFSRIEFAPPGSSNNTRYSVSPYGTLVDVQNTDTNTWESQLHFRPDFQRYFGGPAGKLSPLRLRPVQAGPLGYQLFLTAVDHHYSWPNGHFLYAAAGLANDTFSKNRLFVGRVRTANNGLPTVTSGITDFVWQTTLAASGSLDTARTCCLVFDSATVAVVGARSLSADEYYLTALNHETGVPEWNVTVAIPGVSFIESADFVLSDNGVNEVAVLVGDHVIGHNVSNGSVLWATKLVHNSNLGFDYVQWRGIYLDPTLAPAQGGTYIVWGNASINGVQGLCYIGVNRSTGNTGTSIFVPPASGSWTYQMTFNGRLFAAVNVGTSTLDIARQNFNLDQPFDGVSIAISNSSSMPMLSQHHGPSGGASGMDSMLVLEAAGLLGLSLERPAFVDQALSELKGLTSSDNWLNVLSGNPIGTAVNTLSVISGTSVPMSATAGTLVVTANATDIEFATGTELSVNTPSEFPGALTKRGRAEIAAKHNAQVGALNIGDALLPPRYSVGADGDTKGDLRFSDDYLFHAFRDFQGDGFSDVWKRLAFGPKMTAFSFSSNGPGSKNNVFTNFAFSVDPQTVTDFVALTPNGANIAILLPGTYKITMIAQVVPADGSWPSASNSDGWAFGTAMLGGGIEPGNSMHYRPSGGNNPNMGTFFGDYNTQNPTWTDVYYVSKNEHDSFPFLLSPAMFFAAYSFANEDLNFNGSILVERTTDIWRQVQTIQA